MPATHPSHNRRASTCVQVGAVAIGGGAPVVVQSMTNTDTADAVATAAQVADLARAGSELVRITVNSAEAARAVPEVRERLERMGVRVPLVGDFHFNGHKLLTQYPDCAAALDKYRINPGNVGQGEKRDTQFATLIEIACKHKKPVRIEGAKFDINSAKLKPTADAKLQQVVDFASKYPDADLEVSGHTSSPGSEASNQKLSERRAAAVKAYLVKKGIAANRIAAKGYGETMPVADNKTAEGRAANRRVEIRYTIREEKKVRVQ